MARSQRTPELARIGAVIRDRRERAGDSQRVVAERADLSMYHYSDIENGHQRARRATYMRIAEALGISADDMDDLIGTPRVRAS